MTMTCPKCRTAVPVGEEHCPGCGALVFPPSEGSLAPDPSEAPAMRAKTDTEPLRQIPALQKKDKPSWKDEVRDRVRHRKRSRSAGESLPLFDQEVGEPVADPTPREGGFWRPSEAVPVPPPDGAPLDEDLPLRPAEEPSISPFTDLSKATDDPLAVRGLSEASESPTEDEVGEQDWSVGTTPQPALRPVERPAYVGERVQAGAIDLALLASLSGVVVYFASRRAGVSVLGLRPVWLYLLAYVVFLGLTYAAYFTGTTGQTLGKIATGIRVVHRGSRPPGYSRAFFRATLGLAGILVAFAGLVPMFFDPARRAFHDRLLKTRVVRD